MFSEGLFEYLKIIMVKKKVLGMNNPIAYLLMMALTVSAALFVVSALGTFLVAYNKDFRRATMTCRGSIDFAADNDD